MTWGLLGVVLVVGGAATVRVMSLTRPGSRSRYAWIGAVVAAALVGLGIAISTADESEGRFCAGTAVVIEESGATPEDAVAVYVAAVGGDPGDWERGGLFGDDSFERASAAARPDVDVIFVDEVEPGVWRVTENCVEAGTVEGGSLVPAP